MEFSDGQTLFAVLVFIYLSECFLWVSKQSVAFVSPLCRRFWIKTISFGTFSSGPLFLNPFPPLGAVFLTYIPPISISPEGITSVNLQSLPNVNRVNSVERTFRFLEISKAAADRAYLLINNESFAKCGTATQASVLARFIEELRKATPVERERLLNKQIGKQFLAAEAKKVFEKADGPVADIRLLCAIFFLYLFLFAPFIISVGDLVRMFIPVAVVTFVFAIQIAVMFHRTHKLLFGNSRWDQLIVMVLCPPAAIRASDLLTRNLVSNFSPILISSMLAGPGTARFIRTFINDLRNPIENQTANELSTEIANWSNRNYLRHCIAFVESKKALRSEVNAQMVVDKGCNSYCPRCENQYTITSGDCPDCPGVALVNVAIPGGVG